MSPNSKPFGQTIITDYKGNHIKAKTQGQHEMIQAIDNYDVLFVNGPAGTGKTFLATCKAIRALQENTCERIVLTRPAVESGEELGFLPGNLDDKIAPYMKPLYDSIVKLKGKKADPMNQLKSIAMQQQQQTGKTPTKPRSKKPVEDKHYGDEIDWAKKIEVAPLAYMRGSTFDNSFIIVDECFTENTVIGSNVKGNRTKQTIKGIYNKFTRGEPVHVQSYNEHTHAMETKQVTGVFKKQTTMLVDVKLKNRKKSTTCTTTHPYAILDDDGNISWKISSELVQNDRVIRYASSGTSNSIIPLPSSYDLILGNLLGDASLLPNKSVQSSYRLSWTHGLQQAGYNDFLIKMWNGNLRNGLISGFTKKPITGGISKSLTLSKTFINSVINNGVKCISPEAEKYFSVRSLALWVMDDGYYDSRSETLILNTQGFTKDVNDMLCKWLNNLCGVNPSVYESGDYYIIHLNKSDTRIIQEHISEYVEWDLQYKLPNDLRNKFNGISLQPEFYQNISVSEIASISIYNVAKTDVYNLEVDGNNNYLADGILVHNCQNITPAQMKLLLTRLGDGSKIVLCGDATQSDLDKRVGSGFTLAQKILKGVEGIGFVTLTENDIVRHQLVKDIILSYERYENTEFKRKDVISNTESWYRDGE